MSSRCSTAVLALLMLVHATSGSTIRGYIVDANGHRVAGALVSAWHEVPTDQHPPLRPSLLAEAISHEHGEFSISGDFQTANKLIAEFHQWSGFARPPFIEPVCIELSHHPHR